MRGTLGRGINRPAVVAGGSGGHDSRNVLDGECPSPKCVREAPAALASLANPGDREATCVRASPRAHEGTHAWRARGPQIWQIGVGHGSRNSSDHHCARCARCAPPHDWLCIFRSLSLSLSHRESHRLLASEQRISNSLFLFLLTRVSTQRLKNSLPDTCRSLVRATACSRALPLPHSPQTRHICATDPRPITTRNALR